MQIGLARVATYLSLVLGEGEAWLLLLESPIHDASTRIEWLRGGQLVVSDRDAIRIVAGDACGRTTFLVAVLVGAPDVRISFMLR
jgi:hypothetical protein